MSERPLKPCPQGPPQKLLNDLDARLSRISGALAALELLRDDFGLNTSGDASSAFGALCEAARANLAEAEALSAACHRVCAQREVGA